MLKKLVILIAAAAVSAPAFADRGHGNGRSYGNAYGHAPRVVVHRYYRPAPQPVYVVERRNHVNPVAFLAGAVIGAAIVHHAVTGY